MKSIIAGGLQSRIVEPNGPDLDVCRRHLAICDSEICTMVRWLLTKARMGYQLCTRVAIY